jgi:hypothetical protein
MRKGMYHFENEEKQEEEKGRPLFAFHHKIKDNKRGQ